MTTNTTAPTTDYGRSNLTINLYETKSDISTDPTLPTKRTSLYSMNKVLSVQDKLYGISVETSDLSNKLKLAYETKPSRIFFYFK